MMDTSTRVDGKRSAGGNITIASLLTFRCRGFPDVSAQGAYNAEIWGNETFGAGGTSASTPLFAGVIALVNDALLAKGKPALGFLNPLIYGGTGSAQKSYMDTADIVQAGMKLLRISLSARILVSRLLMDSRQLLSPLTGLEVVEPKASRRRGDGIP